ncbi:MAG: type II CRISPR RNA-guided endonuclease Cas9 [Candidatus Paceibacterota bacterium]|jgi:CRISPR-associated endonuclease Csn1
MKYTLGLDIGTSSVGWAVINNNKNRIEDLGVRLFESAENQKDGESLAKPRRDARGMRHRLARRGYRLDKIKTIFEDEKILTREQIETIHSHPNNPYEIRARGLDKLLTPEELFIAVYHLAKRRGYKSNRKKAVEEDGEKANENRAVLGNIQNNKKLLEAGGYRTVGEMLFKDKNFEAEKRNKQGNYLHACSREMLQEELETLLKTQQTFGNKNVTDKLIEKLAKPKTGAFGYQRHYAQGDQIKKMIGFCTFEPTEMRAAKATYSFQYFNVLQRLNNLKITNKEDQSERPLTETERAKILNRAFSTKEVKYSQIRKDLELKAFDRFNMVQYFIRQKDAAGKTDDEIVDLIEGKSKFPSMTKYYELKKTIGEKDWEMLQKQPMVLDAIATALTVYKTDEDIKKELENITLGDGNKLSESIINATLALSFSDFGHLSLAALRKLIPFLEKGMLYDDACREVYRDHKGFKPERGIKLRPLDVNDHSITNPVVRRSISQTIKVVNAIIDKFGPPTEVHLELGRELAKNHKERTQDHKKQKENAERNDKAKAQIEELGVQTRGGQDIIKFRLWEEQGNKCAYSGNRIDELRLFEDGYTEIDHIVPFSRSFDDSYNNKVLVLKKENQEKGNRIPYEVIGGDADAWARFGNIVNSMNISPRKRQNLLLKKYTGGDITTRSLNDTRFASRYLKNYIADTLLFAEDAPKQKVVTVNGQATAYLRKRWGLNKSREENNRHHAQDAVVVAVTTQGLVQRVMRYSKTGEIVDYLHAHKDSKIVDPETGKEYDDEIAREAKDQYIARHEHRIKFVEPWEGFTRELGARMQDDAVERLKLLQHTLGLAGYPETEDLNFVRPIFVSRMPNHKVTGRAHQETLRSPKRMKNEESVVRKQLSGLTLKTLENMAGKESDAKLYEILKERLTAYGDDPKKAFATPVHKPMKDGTDGPIVRSIKIVSDGQKSGLLVNEGKALVDQDTMVRIDIFSKESKKGKKQFYIIPVYAYHFAKGVLPDKVITAKSEKDWEKIDESFAFEFSLYPNDLVKLTKEDKSLFGYYSGCDRAQASIHILPHDQNSPVRGNGVKTLDNIEKYSIDILGNYHLVRGEKRQEITR